jgi:RecA/RadA recombinase
MKVINLFGPPGSGKSTVAAGLFYRLKSKGIICELTQEYAKELVWAESQAIPSQQPAGMEDQLSIFAEQNRRLVRVNGKIEMAVTDSPLLLSSIYAPAGYPENFHRLVVDIFRSYHNVNFFLERAVPYRNMGRLHDEKQAEDLGSQMRGLLDDLGLPYEVLPGDEAAPEKILKRLVH